MASFLCRSSIEIRHCADKEILELAGSLTIRTAAATTPLPSKVSHKIFLLDFYPTFLLKGLVVLGKFLLNFGLKNLLSVG